MKNKLKNFLKENAWFIISLSIIILLFNINLPYYIDMPGGTININNRIECKKCKDINGSLNMLYVSEYEATIPTYLLSFIIPNWDLQEISTQQINNETYEEIYNRNRLMLNSSINNAIYSAYTIANKKIEIKKQKTLVIATTMDNGLKIGDEILEVDNKKIENADQIKEIINKKEIEEEIEFKVLRNKKEKTIKSKTSEDEKGNKIIGVIIITDYELETDPEIEIKFKASESGSSGGLMMALSIYTKISNEDIVKGRKIAGTGTINANGTVGDIDGIKYKIMGAHKENVDIVLVPSGNYEEALKIKKENNYDLEIVKIEKLKDAITYLKETNKK